MQVRASSQIKHFASIQTIYRQTAVGEQKEGRREKEEEWNTDNIDNESDTIEDVSDNDKRGKKNHWRDSGYITSDSEDSVIKHIEISDKNPERIASIFWF